MKSFKELIQSEIYTVTYRFWCPKCGMMNQIDVSKGKNGYFFENIECPKCKNAGQVYYNKNSRKVMMDWDVVELKVLR